MHRACSQRQPTHGRSAALTFSSKLVKVKFGGPRTLVNRECLDGEEPVQSRANHHRTASPRVNDDLMPRSPRVPDVDPAREKPHRQRHGRREHRQKKEIQRLPGCEHEDEVPGDEAGSFLGSTVMVSAG
jgi:hypothetical protein